MERAILWGGGGVMESSILVMGAHCPWKYPFFGLDRLERVHSEEVRRWENLLEKDLGITHFLREGNGRAHVKKGFPAPPVWLSG